jgi:hypothetical protein
MYIEKVANFGVAMATLGHNIDPSLVISINKIDNITNVYFMYNNY